MYDRGVCISRGGRSHTISALPVSASGCSARHGGGFRRLAHQRIYIRCSGSDLVSPAVFPIGQDQSEACPESGGKRLAVHGLCALYVFAEYARRVRSGAFFVCRLRRRSCGTSRGGYGFDHPVFIARPFFFERVCLREGLDRVDELIVLDAPRELNTAIPVVLDSVGIGTVIVREGSEFVNSFRTVNIVEQGGFFTLAGSPARFFGDEALYMNWQGADLVFCGEEVSGPLPGCDLLIALNDSSLLRKSSVRLPAPFILKKRPASSTFIRQATCK